MSSMSRSIRRQAQRNRNNSIARKVCPDCGSSEVRQKFTSFLKNIGGSSGSGGGCAVPSGSPFG